MKKSTKQTLEHLAIEHINNLLSKDTYILFKDDMFTFYDDSCGQRLHKVTKYSPYGDVIFGMYRVIRVLSFENEIDKGKDGAILGVLDLNKAKLISIHPDKIEYEFFTVLLKR